MYVRTWYVSRDPVSYIVRAYLVSYCLRVRQQQRFDHPTLKPTSVLLGCIKNSTISSKHVHCCINKHTNRGHNLHGHVDKKKGKHKNENIKQEKKQRGAGFRTRDLSLDCLMEQACAPQRHEFAKTIHATFLYTTARLHPFSMQLPAVQEGQALSLIHI